MTDGTITGRPYLETIVRFTVELMKTPSPTGAYHALKLAVTTSFTVLYRTYRRYSDPEVVHLYFRIHYFPESLLERSHPGDTGFPSGRHFPMCYDARPLPQQLRKAWQHHGYARNSEGYQKLGGGDCFHEQHADMLGLLQQEAQHEVRACTLLAVGRHLPAELAELVFEYTLAAEGIPVVCRTRDSDELIRDEVTCDFCGRPRPPKPLAG